MFVNVNPCLSLVIANLTKAGPENFAVWVHKSPVSSGLVNNDCIWSVALTRTWLAWQEMFSLQSQDFIAPINHEILNNSDNDDPNDIDDLPIYGENYSGRLMEYFGILLWQWLFDGSIVESLAQSKGIAIALTKPLRIQLEIRDPNLIPLPWEIMQQDAGKPPISINEQIVFSRTTTDTEPLNHRQDWESLNILLVLGEEEPNTNLFSQESKEFQRLNLEKEAQTLAEVIKKISLSKSSNKPYQNFCPATVTTLIQPTASQLIESIATGKFNTIFYAGHGEPSTDGGLLFLSSHNTINGKELASYLVRYQISLAVFNACWGAESAQVDGKLMERSSLTEVLIHYGVPAVLGMRDSIADEEALSFIEVFTKALCQRESVDRAVTIARQHLFSVYKVNQPTWTLPILYMHPDFEGHIIRPLFEEITQLPIPSPNRAPLIKAYLRSVEDHQQVWKFDDRLRIGRKPDNDLVINQLWVSRKHADIVCRDFPYSDDRPPRYFLRDRSRFGTFIYKDNKWQKIHNQEILLSSGDQIRFGNTEGQILEFVIETEKPNFAMDN